MSDNKNLIFPSTKMLPMNDIAQELNIVHKFALSTQKAGDTILVDGIAANNIAAIALDEHNDPYVYKDEDDNIIINARETVKNTLCLNGLKAEEYLTKDEGAVIENVGTQISKIYADEIACLRDELYQLRGELTRNGFINEYGLYSGFQDFFKASDVKYLVTRTEKNGETVETIELCKLSPNFVNDTNVNKIIPSQNGIIKEGDYFLISKTDTNENYLVHATKVELITSEEEVTFETPMSPAGIPSIDNPTKVIITKIAGDYFNGSFSFSQVKKYALTNKEKYTMLNDDSKTSLARISEPKTGYGSAFRVPSNSGGALKSFAPVLRINGSPGSLTCYVIKESDLPNITNLSVEEVGEDKLLVAKSKPVPCLEVSPLNLTEVHFDFSNDGENYPILTGGERYACILVAETASLSDFWEVQFSQAASNVSDPDVQTNNNSYSYFQGEGFSNVNNLGDMIFTLATIEVKENTETPLVEGLYTSQLIKVSNNSSLARGRLSMRINREGMFTSATNGIINDGGVLRLNTVGVNPDDLGINAGETVIIGDNIRKATGRVANKVLPIDKATSVAENDIIYRMGYKVFLRATKKEWTTGAIPKYVTTSDICLPMELKAVMTDDYKLSNEHSDRLIFECEFRDEKGLAVDANEFQVQVVWNSNLSIAELISTPEYTGRIYDLNLSFDKIL